MSGADEFSMEEARMVLLRSHRRKIERLFGVSLSPSQSDGRFDGLPADTRYHWLKLTGGDGDRKSAREYINSLCYPEEKQFLTNSTNTPALNDITFLEETEKQTKSYIVLDKEKSLISISGSPLAVTLALSIFEDSINQFSKEKKEDNEIISPAENGSDLSSAARRLSNCLESALLNFGSKDYNYEDLKPFSESVKRSFLESFSLEINSDDCNIETDGIQFNDLLPKEPINSQKTSEFPVARHQLKENTFDDSEDNLGFNRVSVIKSTAVEMGFSERDIDKVMETAKEPMIPSEILKQLSIISQMQENRMPDSECKTDKNRELPDSYIERLAQDFEEETGNLPVDELKWRNAQRLWCLAEAIEHGDCQSVCSSSSPDVRKADVVGKRELVSEKYKNKKKSNCKSDQLVPPSFNSSPKLGRKKEKTMACNKVKSKKKKTPEVVEAKSYRLPKAAGGIKTNFQRSLNTQSFDEEETCVMVHWTPPGNDAAVYEQQKWMQKVPDEQQTPSKLPPHSSILRYIVVDGSNVAMTHGNGQVFSCRGIQICVEYFLKRGHEVTVFVPHFRMRTPTDRYPMTDQHIMNQLKKDRILVLTPSRIVNKREIVCYDDKYILNLAEKMDGVIVSNDQYRDLMFEKRSWKKIIEERLLMYSFVGDNFMPPEDPLGRYGPNLDSFLCKPWEQRPCDTSRKQERIHGNTRYARQQQYKLINPRSQQETDELFMQLRVIFSEPYQKDIINRILTDHRTIRNVEKLSNLILSAFSPSLV